MHSSVTAQRLLQPPEVAYRLVDPGLAPDKMEIELNETLAQAIERQTVPSYRLIERLELPSRIVAPELQQGLGKSTLTTSGFVDDWRTDRQSVQTEYHCVLL
jgi:hypothetical protein